METDSIPKEVHQKEVRFLVFLCFGLLVFGLVVGGYLGIMKASGVISPSCQPYKCQTIKFTGCTSNDEAMKKVGKFLSENKNKTYKKMWVEADEKNCTMSVFVFFSKKSDREDAQLGRKR